MLEARSVLAQSSVLRGRADAYAHSLAQHFNNRAHSGLGFYRSMIIVFAIQIRYLISLMTVLDIKLNQMSWPIPILLTT